MAEDGKDAKKKKRPTALKRVEQSKKKHALNRSFKSRVRTAIRTFESALSSGEKDQVQEALNSVYSLMDKGVKKGIYKTNKAARVKMQMSKLEKKTA